MRTVLTAFCLLSLVGVCLISTDSYAQEKQSYLQENVQEKLTTRPSTVMACMKADRTCTKDSECCSEVCFKNRSNGISKCWPKVVLW
jgi:hypothetical protein